MNNNSNVLLVDDNLKNLAALEDIFDADYHPSHMGCNLEKAENGLEALKKMEVEPEKFDLVLLDIMMPIMDGWEVLKRMQANDALREIPVILQTAKGMREDIERGLASGARHYLVKPLSIDDVLPLVRVILEDRSMISGLQVEMEKVADAFSLVKTMRLKFRTLAEVHNAALITAKICPDPRRSLRGFVEIYLNSVEHGNCGITYAEKTAFLRSHNLPGEIEKRLALPKNKNKIVRVTIQKRDKEIWFMVKDEGEGFDWSQYMDFDPKRGLHLHGRGIATANKMSFDSIQYIGKGNAVLIKVKLD